jgi:hypothetical protein
MSAVSSAAAALVHRCRPDEVVMSYLTMQTALTNFLGHGKRLGHVVNPKHNAQGDRRSGSPSMRAAVDMYSVLARRRVTASGRFWSGKLKVGGKSFDLTDDLPVDDPVIASRLKVSPFGDMTTMTTVVDREVRDALELNAADGAECTLESGVDEDANYEEERFNDFEHIFGSGIEFEFDKLNIYREGGHFKPHLDTPSPGVLGSLVIILPNKFTGGELVIRHGGEEVVTGESKEWWRFVAFFASCEHEVRPVTSGTRVSLAFKIKATDRHCAAALAPTEKARVDTFVDELARVGQKDTEDGIVGVLLNHEYSLGACQRGELVGIDRAVWDAVRARFPATKLTSVIARADFARLPEHVDERVEHPTPFRNVVFDASLEEIERLGAMEPTARDEDGKDVAEDKELKGVPFLRANDWHGTEILTDFREGRNYGNWVGNSTGECVYLHAALVIPTGDAAMA